VGRLVLPAAAASRAAKVAAQLWPSLLNEGASGTRDRNFLTLIYIQGSWWKVCNLHHRALFCVTLHDPISAFSEASHRSHRPHSAFESTTIQEKSLILVVPPWTCAHSISACFNKATTKPLAFCMCPLRTRQYVHRGIYNILEKK